MNYDAPNKLTPINNPHEEYGCWMEQNLHIHFLTYYGCFRNLLYEFHEPQLIPTKQYLQNN